MITTITIDMDRKCEECGKGGAAGGGICLGCAAKVLKRRTAKSAAGKAMLDRFTASLELLRMPR